MKIGCRCGYIIVDNTDNLPYVGYVIHNQDYYGYLAKVSNALKEYLEALEQGQAERWRKAHSDEYRLREDTTSTKIVTEIIYDTPKVNSFYECPNCLNVVIFDSLFGYAHPFERVFWGDEYDTLRVMSPPKEREALRTLYSNNKSQRTNEVVMSSVEKLPLSAEVISEQAQRILSQCNDDRPGVCTLEPHWIMIPGGISLCGSSEDELIDPRALPAEMPNQYINLPTYAISRYPVTNAQYARFVQAGGYRTATWWQKGWELVQDHGWHGPLYWDDEHFNGPSQPVVGISVFEAAAYCAWLSAELNLLIELPIEVQWEKAARGLDGRIYPWGNMWRAHKANTIATKVGRPLNVGILPGDRSPYDVKDMAGNICEWTLGHWYAYLNVETFAINEIEPTSFVVLRGASWIDEGSEWARCAARGGSEAGTRCSYHGFRVITNQFTEPESEPATNEQAFIPIRVTPSGSSYYEHL